ncbi:inorganic phosphate transporter, partial [Amycolatopsis samaneae]
VGAIAAEVSMRGSWGTILVGTAGVLVALGIYLASKRNPVTAKTINEPENEQPHPVAA